MGESKRASLRELVFERDGWECVRCGTGKELTLDHWIPKSRGGTDEPGNLVTMCKRHNEQKGNSVPSERMPCQTPLPTSASRIGPTAKRRRIPTTVCLGDLHPRIRALL